jgi:signal peptidase I
MADQKPVADQAAAAIGSQPMIKKKHVVREYAESIVIAVLLALVIRTFVVQAFKIPSGSMEDTLLIGDQLLVNKFIYGTHLPFTNKEILRLRDPRQGDVIVFEYPPDTKDETLRFWQKKDFIKRVVGTPGDKIEVKDKVVYVNGKVYHNDHEVHKDSSLIERCSEGTPRENPCWRDNFGPVIVPAGEYFVMGDNRDRSFDSRFWGFVPKENIRGLAFILYWSRGDQFYSIRWNRLGNIIH